MSSVDASWRALLGVGAERPRRHKGGAGAGVLSSEVGSRSPPRSRRRCSIYLYTFLFRPRGASRDGVRRRRRRGGERTVDVSAALTRDMTRRDVPHNCTCTERMRRERMPKQLTAQLARGVGPPVLARRRVSMGNDCRSFPMIPDERSVDSFNESVE